MYQFLLIKYIVFFIFYYLDIHIILIYLFKILIIIIFIILFGLKITLNDRLSTMACNACVNQINTLNQIVEMAIHTNDLMIKLLEKKDSVRNSQIDVAYNLILN